MKFSDIKLEKGEALVLRTAKADGTSHNSKLAASGYYSQLAASGKKSIAIAAGRYSTVSAAEDGCIALSWWDEKAQRFRLTVGYVGEGDIKPNTIYRLNAAGEFEEVK